MTQTALQRIVVVIPTRNRADFAELTVRSVLDQAQAARVTVLVSDNSTDQAQVATLKNAIERVRQEHPESDVLLVRPDQPLPMGEHWEWARTQATAVAEASHLLYLTDRTLLKIGALDVLLDVVRRSPDQVVSFNHDLIDDGQTPARLIQESWTGEVVSIPTRRLLELSSEMIVVRPLPRALNSLIPLSVLTLVDRIFGDAFNSTAPDFCFCYRFLETTATMIYVDRALTVMHGLARSNGNSTTTGRPSPDTVDFINAASAQGIARFAPLPMVTTTYNVIASEYQDDPGRRRPALNRRAYVEALARETDGFVAGPMRDANVGILAAEGVGFGRFDARRRQISQALHYVRVLGPFDFVLLGWDRLRSTGASTFLSKEQALTAGRQVGRLRRSRHLRYLRGTRITF